jgi:hypothetical protein
MVLVDPDAVHGRRWLCGIALWVFDLDHGQKLSNIHPADALTEEETQDIACLSFPVCLCACVTAAGGPCPPQGSKPISLPARCRRQWCSHTAVPAACWIGNILSVAWHALPLVGVIWLRACLLCKGSNCFGTSSSHLLAVQFLELAPAHFNFMTWNVFLI